MKTFLSSRLGLRCTQRAMLMCESVRCRGYFFFFDNVCLVLILDEDRSFFMTPT